MTSNSLKYADNKISEGRAKTEDRKAKETERYNRKRENAQNFKDYTSGYSNVAKGVKDAFGTAGALGGLIAGNDPAWYTTDKQLTKDVGALSFGRPAGLPFDGANLPLIGMQTLIPSMAVYNFVPTLGATNVADIAARNVYAFVRYKNSGHANYDAPDLMMYLLAVDSMFYTWAELTRLYAALKYVNTMNRASQKRLIEALGFDYDDSLVHMNDIRVFVNTLKLRLSSFYLPKALTYYQRHMWMAANVFADDKLQKSQWHIFKPAVYFSYDEIDGELFPAIFSGKRKFATWTAEINLQLNQLVQSESIGIMSGDILKAYGDGQTVSLNDISEDYTLNIIYSDEVLEQIQNATVFEHIDSAVGATGFVIYQDKDTGAIHQGLKYGDKYLTTKPVIWYDIRESSAPAPDLCLYTNRFLFAKDDQPSTDRVFTMTRLTATAKTIAQSILVGEAPKKLDAIVAEQFGSEVICGCQVIDEESHHVWDGMADGSIARDVPSLLSTLENAPYIRVLSGHYAKHELLRGVNAIIVGNEVLFKLHNVAIMSMFGLPYTASLNKPALR